MVPNTWRCRRRCNMSRSQRSEPVKGITTSESEKEWKRENNRRLRRSSAQVIDQISKGADPDAMVLPAVNEISELWDGPKDGKFRFDPKERPKLMRK